MTNNTYTGSIKWFNHKRGYGFLKDCDSAEDIFVHFSAINVPDGVYKTLIDGEYVQYELSPDTKDGKPMALNVTGVKGGPLLCQLENKRVQVIYTRPVSGDEADGGRPIGRGRGRGRGSGRGSGRGRGRGRGSGRVVKETSSEEATKDTSHTDNRYESLNVEVENEVDV